MGMKSIITGYTRAETLEYLKRRPRVHYLRQGDLLHLSDGRVMWLGWWDRLALWIGWTTVHELDGKYSR